MRFRRRASLTSVLLVGLLSPLVTASPASAADPVHAALVAYAEAADPAAHVAALAPAEYDLVASAVSGLLDAYDASPAAADTWDDAQVGAFLQGTKLVAVAAPEPCIPSTINYSYENECDPALPGVPEYEVSPGDLPTTGPSVARASRTKSMVARATGKNHFGHVLIKYGMDWSFNYDGVYTRYFSTPYPVYARAGWSYLGTPVDTPPDNTLAPGINTGVARGNYKHCVGFKGLSTCPYEQTLSIQTMFSQYGYAVHAGFLTN